MNPNQDRPATIGSIDEHAVDPVTTERLKEYAHRRRWLTLIRGLCVSLMAGSVLLIFGTLIDACWVGNSARWTACLVFYVPLLSVLIWQVILPWIRPTDFFREASEFGRQVPDLSELLPTALELGERNSGDGSAAFCEAIQAQTANEMESLDVGQLLPLQRIQSWLRYAGASLVFLFALSLFPGVYFLQRSGRILFPLADLGRVSLTRIEITRPLPRSKTLALGDTLLIEARVSGWATEELATLEIETGESNLTSIQLLPNTDISSSSTKRAQNGSVRRTKLVSSTFQIDQPQVRYRARIGSATTPWYTLSAVPRPRIREFTRSVRLPDYAGSQPLPIRSVADGNARVLRGSQLHFDLRAEPANAKARLLLEEPVTSSAVGDTNRPSTEIDLKRKTATGRFWFERTADASFSYRIRVTDTTHGFSNSFAPQYRVEAVPDQPPRVHRIAPKSLRSVIAANALVDFQYRVSDELPIHQIEHLVSINGSEWQSTQAYADGTATDPHEDSSKTSFPFADSVLDRIADSTQIARDIDLRLDLLRLSTKSGVFEPGDRIQVKARVTDLAGNVAESEESSLSISSVQLELTETDVESRRAQAANLLRSVTETIPAGRELENLSDEQVRGVSTNTAKRLDAILPQLTEEMKLALQTNRDPSIAVELLSLTLATHELSANLNQQVQTANPIGDSASLRTTLNRLRLVSNGAGQFVAHDSALRHVQELQSLLMAFRDLAAIHNSEPENKVTSSSIEQSKRHLSVLNRQLRELTQGILDGSSALDTTRRQNRRHAVDRLQTIATHSEERLERITSTTFSQQVEQTIRELTGVANMANIDAGVFDASANSLRTLRDLIPPTERIFQRIHGNPALRSSLTAAVDELRQRRATFNQDRTAVPGFAADLGQAARALELLAADDQPADAGSSPSQPVNGSDQDPVITLPPERVHAISEAVSVLQLANDFEIAITHLRSLTTAEDSLDASRPDLKQIYSNPRRWDSYESNLENVLRHLQTTNIPEELKQRIRTLRWNQDVASAKDALVSRRWSNDSLRSASRDLLRIKKTMQDVQSELQPYINAARARLAAMGPSIESLAQTAASAARDLSRSTRALSESQSTAEPQSRSAAQLQRNRTQEQSAGRATQTLRDALVDFAEAQNFTDSQQVSRALLADAGIRVVDQAQEFLQDSELPNSGAKPSTSQLNEFADMQSEAASALDAVAAIFQNHSTESSADARDSAKEELEQLAAQLQKRPITNQLDEQANVDANQSRTNNTNGPLRSSEPQRTDEASQLADRAQRLAQLAEADPRQVLAELESRLEGSPAMQSELSTIARQVAGEALTRIEQAALGQEGISMQIELSDPQVASERDQKIYLIKEAQKAAVHIADTLLRELELSTQLSKSEKLLDSVQELRQELTSWNEEQTTQLSGLSSRSLSTVGQNIAAQLSGVRDRLVQLQGQLQETSDSAIHQNGAELNNRRRAMRDRSKNLFRKHLSHLQNIESRAKQRARQTESELQRDRKRLQTAAQNSRAAQKKLDSSHSEANQKHARDQRRKAALVRMQMNVQQEHQSWYANQLKQANKAIIDFKSSPAPELQARNPSAEWAASLSELTRRLASDSVKSLTGGATSQSGSAAARVQTGSPTAVSPRGEQDALKKAVESEAALRSAITDAVEDLRRAARHEARLGQPANSIQLGAFAGAVHDVNRDTLAPAEEELRAAWVDAQENVDIPAAAQATTSTAIEASSLAANTLHETARRIAQFLNPENQLASHSQPSTPRNSSPGNSPKESSGRAEREQLPPESNLLTPQQMANLLDELDQQLNGTELGAKEDDAANPSTGTRNGAPAATLAEAARDTAQSMSRARSPDDTKGNADLGTATDADSARVAVEGPTEVELLRVDRVDGDWGKLRERANEKANSPNVTRFTPQLQRQVDAYFQRIAETEDKP